MTQQMIASMRDAFAKTGLGDDFASQMTSNVLGAFDKNLAALRHFEDQWNRAGNDLRKQAELLRGVQWLDR